MWPQILGIVGSLIDKVLPDPEKANEAKLKLLQMQMENDQLFAKLDAETRNKQLDINAAEAQSTNPFVSGWRPFIGWVCGGAFAWQFVLGPILFYCLQLANVQVPPIPHFDMEALMPVLLGLLGLGGMRTYEKVKRVTK